MIGLYPKIQVFQPELPERRHLTKPLAPRHSSANNINKVAADIRSVQLYFGIKQLSAKDQLFIETLKDELMKEHNETLDTYLSEHSDLFGSKELNKDMESFFDSVDSKKTEELEAQVKQLKKIITSHPENHEAKLLYGIFIHSLVVANYPETLKENSLAEAKTLGQLFETTFPIKRMMLNRQHIKLLTRNIEDKNVLLKKMGIPDLESKRVVFDLDSLKDESLPSFLNQTKKLYWDAVADAASEKGLSSSASSLSEEEVKQAIFWLPELLNDIKTEYSDLELINLVHSTVDKTGLALDFESLAEPLTFKTLKEYEQFKTESGSEKQILYDLREKTGADIRAHQMDLEGGNKAIFVVPFGENLLDKVRIFLHELGHAFHLIHTEPKSLFSRLYSANLAVTETYAFLFENLKKNSHWLINKAGLTKAQAKAQVKNEALKGLTSFRADLTELDFQLSLRDGTPVADKPKRFKKASKENLGFTDYAKEWTFITDSWEQGLSYLMANIFSAKLEQNMKVQFGAPEHNGEDWYENPKAGEYLKKLWAKGAPPVEEFAKELGLKHALDPQAFIENMENALK